MIEILALLIILLTGIYFLALASACLLVPRLATRFLLGFAGSPVVHYTEQFTRLLVGGSLVIYAPYTLASGAVRLFGWIILITTFGLLLLPWRWHHRFAQKVVPPATRYIAVIGLFSLALGGFIFWAVVGGRAT